jgi:hypothetical protein
LVLRQLAGLQRAIVLHNHRYSSGLSKSFQCFSRNRVHEFDVTWTFETTPSKGIPKKVVAQFPNELRFFLKAQTLSQQWFQIF